MTIKNKELIIVIIPIGLPCPERSEGQAVVFIRQSWSAGSSFLF